jgi:asparagine synthase (glutamine-hydrolysing)
MCGIGGILRTDGQPIPDAWLNAIDARIAYRGPDGHGRFRDSVTVQTEHGEKRIEVGLVHRRLSIIDHADGAQPMVSQRGRTDEEGLVAVVFNGCIYNHRALREELKAEGHVFETDHSDTEVLIHGWRQWGMELCNHLIGMFAFAIWDRTQAALAVARDDFGEKPLYMHIQDSRIGNLQSRYPFEVVAFASSVPALHALDDEEERTPKHQWLAWYIRRGYTTWVASQRPLTYPVHAGATDRFHFGDEQPNVAYSRPAVIPDSEPADPERIVDLLDHSVRARLEADVPLGCFLSGGVDSSLIAHFAMKHTPDLHTFSVKMPDARYDESQHAERVADHLGTHHTTLQCDPNPADDLVHLINILGQPFGDSSILPTYWVSKAARVHVKVVLSGDGGDELFLGYERYLVARLLAKRHQMLRMLPSRMFKRSHPKSRIHKLGRIAEMARDFPEVGLSTLGAIFTADEVYKLLETRDIFPKRLIDTPRCALWDGIPIDKGDPISILQYYDITSYLRHDLLRKVDTASMACGLEVRCPFLDRDLASTVLAMPIDDLIPGGKRKGLLRNIARRYLPADVVDRPKMGFAIPIGEWFRSDYGSMKTLLLDQLYSAEPFGPISLNRRAVQRYIDEHMRGTYDHGQKLFLLLTLSIWARSVASTT